MILSVQSGVAESVYGKSQEPIKMFVDKLEEQFEAQSQLKNIFYMDKTNVFAEKYTGMVAFEDFEPVGEGGVPGVASTQEGYDKVITPYTWKKEFALTQEMVEDRVLFKKARMESIKMMQSYYRTREKFGAALLASGTATTMSFAGRTWNIAANDTKALFATDHPSVLSETADQSNLYAGAFSYDNFQKVVEKMQNRVDDRGNILNVTPDTIVIPNDARAAARVIETLGSIGKPGTADNDASSIAGQYNIVVWSYLNQFISGLSVTAGEFPWWVIDKGNNDLFGGLICLDRIPLSMRSYIDDRTDNNIWHGRARWTMSPNEWRYSSLVVPGGSGTAL